MILNFDRITINPRRRMPRIKVVLLVHGGKKPLMMFSLGKRTPLCTISECYRKLYEKRFGVIPDVELKFKSIKIQKKNTPMSLGVENGDVVRLYHMWKPMSLF